MKVDGKGCIASEHEVFCDFMTFSSVDFAMFLLTGDESNVFYCQEMPHTVPSEYSDIVRLVRIYDN